jgi:hypothetical protein
MRGLCAKHVLSALMLVRASIALPGSYGFVRRSSVMLVLLPAQ